MIFEGLALVHVLLVSEREERDNAWGNGEHIAEGSEAEFVKFVISLHSLPGIHDILHLIGHDIQSILWLYLVIAKELQFIETLVLALFGNQSPTLRIFLVDLLFFVEEIVLIYLLGVSHGLDVVLDLTQVAPLGIFGHIRRNIQI